MPRQRKPAAVPSEPLIKISEDEQWRLINESGVLHKISGQENPVDEVKPEEPSPFPLVDEILDTSLLIIPFCSLLIVMEMCAF